MLEMSKSKLGINAGWAADIMQDLSSPFRVGQQYRVRRDYSFLNHNFCAGEIVTFSAHSYSAKEGVMRFWFKRDNSEETNVWHVFDNQKQEISWHEMFDEIFVA
jgi:hypothetical protein